MWHVRDKFIVTMEEITKDLSLDEGVFKTIVTKGMIEINVKHGKSFMKRVGLNLVCAGNEGMGNFANKGNSVARRLLIFGMHTIPKNVDRTLQTQVFFSHFCNR